MEAMKMKLFVTLMMVVLVALAAAQTASAAEAPAPSPASDASAFVPTFLASVAALALVTIFLGLRGSWNSPSSVGTLLLLWFIIKLHPRNPPNSNAIAIKFDDLCHLAFLAQETIQTTSFFSKNV
ncbi:hypothetical protein NL676_031525 [Syzygium grande]|nr:hypothetical protein NL676_031525 [Syzygium grande]